MTHIKKILIFIPLFLSLIGTSYALETIKREDIGLDETLFEQSDVYSSPQKIYISQVEGFNKELKDDPKEWIKLLYYYSITRLNLNDIPYNYLIDANGKIYEGASGGIGINPGLEGGDNVVLIGILDDGINLSPRAATALKEFLEELSYTYGIERESVDFVDLKINQKTDGFSYLEYSQSDKAIKDSLTPTLTEVQWSDTEHIKYKGSIVSVDYEKEVVIGSRLDVKVKIKNENDFPWFGGETYIYISTKDYQESPYAINSDWVSFSKATYIQNEIIKPGQEAEITFQLSAKSRPGEYDESFVFMKTEDNLVEDSSFDVKFNIVKGDNTIVEIVSPQYGFVNIRECRWYSCKKIEVANEGDVFITTKKEEGWYEILYDEGKKGWVYQTYAREI
jgi:hypothetical protein